MEVEQKEREKESEQEKEILKNERRESREST